jgi:hypothetical protein
MIEPERTRGKKKLDLPKKQTATWTSAVEEIGKYRFFGVDITKATPTTLLIDGRTPGMYERSLHHRTRKRCGFNPGTTSQNCVPEIIQ